MLVNPCIALCHLKYRDDEQLIECKAKRHRLGDLSKLSKLIDSKEGHMTIYHSDAAAKSVALRMREVLARPRMQSPRRTSTKQQGG